MRILRIPAGIYAANCYIVYSETTQDGIIVDPGGDAAELLQAVKENDINLKYIVLTHGHGDHIGGVSGIKSKLNIPLLVHEDDVELIEDGSKNMSSVMAMGPVEIHPDKTLKNGDIIEFGDIAAKVIHTPGHTKGGICLLIEDHLISGDTLFKSSVGRSDLPGGDHKTLIKSIKNRVLSLPDNTIVLPGHGESTTVGREKQYNQFLR